MRLKSTPAGVASAKPPSAWWSWPLVALFVAALWLATYFCASMLEYQEVASLWYPPAAVTFAAFAVFRRGAWPGVFLANAVATMLMYRHVGMDIVWYRQLTVTLLFTLAHCLPYWLCAEAVLQSIPRNTAPSLARTVGIFLLAGIFAALIAAIGGAWVSVYAGQVVGREIWTVILPWLIGDIAGLLSAGPLLAMVLRHVAARLRVPVPHRLYAFDDLPRPPRNLRAFALKLMLTLGTACLSLLAIAQAPDNEPLLFIVFIAIVLQLWIVHTQGAMESLVSVALFNLTLVALVYGLHLRAHALTLQFAMITLAAGSYYGLAVPMLYADNAQLRRLLIHDALTGAYNRHFFVELSHQAIRQSRISERPVSMFMIDMDNLKLINDRHGHAAGDHALAHIADVCRTALSANDLLGRLGGDEFCALLPGQDHTQAAATAARLLAAVRGSDYPFPTEVRPSLSIGIATTQGDTDDYESLWMRADSALYVAKRGGRDRIAQEEAPVGLEAG